MTASNVSNQTYEVNSTAVNFSVPAYTYNYQICLDFPITYQAKLVNDSSVNELPSFITFYSNNRTFNVNSNDTGVAGNYTI